MAWRETPKTPWFLVGNKGMDRNDSPLTSPIAVSITHSPGSRWRMWGFTVFGASGLGFWGFGVWGFSVFRGSRIVKV